MIGPGDVSKGHRTIVATALARYGLELEAIEPIAESFLNANYRASTADGPRFVRIHRVIRDRLPLEREVRVVRWLAGRGQPVVPPLAADGDWLHRIGGRFVSVYPWVEGRRLDARPDDAAIVGRTLGDLHTVLAGYGDPTLESDRAGSAWDTSAAVNTLSRIDDLIRYYPSPSAENLRIQAALRYQLELLEGSEAQPAADFADLDRQPCHGDFHGRNVLLHPGPVVAAVVDWEVVSLLPPVYEILRCLACSGFLDVSEARSALIGGYRARAALDQATARAGVQMFWQGSLHDTWVYRRVFIEGDRSAARFLAETDARLRRLADPDVRRVLAEELAG